MLRSFGRVVGGKWVADVVGCGVGVSARGEDFCVAFGTFAILGAMKVQ